MNSYIDLPGLQAFATGIKNAIPEKDKVLMKSQVATLWAGSQSQFDALTSKDPSTIYFIYDD